MHTLLSLLPLGEGGYLNELGKIMTDLDFGAVRNTISGVVRMLGFGPEADNLATGLAIILFLLVVVGYAAGPGDGGKGDKSPEDKSDAAKRDEKK